MENAYIYKEMCIKRSIKTVISSNTGSSFTSHIQYIMVVFFGFYFCVAFIISRYLADFRSLGYFSQVYLTLSHISERVCRGSAAS